MNVITHNNYTILHKGLEHPEIFVWGQGTAAVLELTPAILRDNCIGF